LPSIALAVNEIGTVRRAARASWIQSLKEGPLIVAGGGGDSKTAGVYVHQKNKVLRLQQTEQEPKTSIETKRTNGKVGTEQGG